MLGWGEEWGGQVREPAKLLQWQMLRTQKVGSVRDSCLVLDPKT